MNTHSKYYWFLIAGLLGGLSEVVWISLYSLATNIQLSDIGSAITATIFPSSIEFYLAPLMGLAIHMILSILLAFGFGLLLLPLIEQVVYSKATTILFTSIITLVIVWKVNFFLLLPIWNPEFISLIPMSITLISKILFGLTMGIVLSNKMKLESDYNTF